MSTSTDPVPTPNGDEPAHQPYVADSEVIPEFTWGPLLIGVLLGIVFGASSLYLLLKVGMTVSASVPIAVLSITLFRAFSKWFGIRRATILENNIVQTTGSAGESIAFGVGVTMPALLLLGLEMSWERVMTVSVLGGLLGILMMIPLRRAFIVKQHGKLRYPEGTACAEVLTAGEKGGASARMVFVGFGIAAIYTFLVRATRLWSGEPSQSLSWEVDGKRRGLPGAEATGELYPEMLGVGYLIGPRIACMMMAGAVLSFFVIGPLIATFGQHSDKHVPPAVAKVDADSGKDKGLIRNMGPGDLYRNYLRYIGAGAVAAGGIISMFRALPLIIASIVAGVRDLRSSGPGAASTARTERDLSIKVVLFGCLGLVLALAGIPQLGLGLTMLGILGACMILLLGFLFVTVSSRLTGEVGSSSNPISGMTIATLLLTCLVFAVVGKADWTAWLTAMSVAAVVCIASSNGGTTSQDLKTGYLVGATPKYQQYGILIGTLGSALVIGVTMIVLNAGGTHYTKKGDWQGAIVQEPAAARQKVGRPYEGKDDKEYHIVHIRDDREHQQKYPNVPPGRYLTDETGKLTYRADVPINRQAKNMDNPDDPTKEGAEAPEAFKAPQPQLFSLIIKGILGGDLEWTLVILGALIAIAMELMGVPALPVAVGMYLGLGTATPIFFGGMVRWLTDRLRGVSASEAETETSPGVLLASGYIAGGTLCGLLLGFGVMLTPDIMTHLNIGHRFGKDYEETAVARLLAVAAFLGIAAYLLYVGTRRTPEAATASDAGPPSQPAP